ncbi:uncharacterized protein LOC129314401 isoform X2 [Prosopis cineraria]|uniref:uncharacterized protein LOC129314401 isoform X2 n=1 Tax=Prosopis cineraria TaxID=364024 RepID=UPI00240EAF2E|nr:uncharacterized protein LOC129314401 isoform X2 [Prosopis cineraria]
MAKRYLSYEIMGNGVEESSDRFGQLCYMLLRLAAEASECPKTFAMFHEAMLKISKKVEEILKKQTNAEDMTSLALPEKVDAQSLSFKKRDGMRRKRRLKKWVKFNKLKTKRRKTCSTVTASQAPESKGTQMQYGMISLESAVSNNVQSVPSLPTSPHSLLM